MIKSKVLSFYPGDDVNITIKSKFEKFSILKIEVIELDQPISDTISVEL